MSRITMELAGKIAEALTLKHYTKWKDKEVEISTFVRDCYLQDVPEKIKLFFDAFPKWAESTKYIYVNANGNSRFGISVKPAPSESERSACVTLTKTQSDKLSKLRHDEDKLENDYFELKKSVYNALIQLRTFKNIEEKFPEAAQYFPIKKDSNLLPALNIDKIRKQIQ